MTDVVSSRSLANHAKTIYTWKWIKSQFGWTIQTRIINVVNNFIICNNYLLII